MIMGPTALSWRRFKQKLGRVKLSRGKLPGDETVLCVHFSCPMLFLGFLMIRQVVVFVRLWSLLVRAMAGPPAFRRPAFSISNGFAMYLSMKRIFTLSNPAGTPIGRARQILAVFWGEAKAATNPQTRGSTRQKTQPRLLFFTPRPAPKTHLFSWVQVLS